MNKKIMMIINMIKTLTWKWKMYRIKFKLMHKPKKLTKNNNRKWRNRFKSRMNKINLIMMMLKKKMIRSMKKIREMISLKFLDLSPRMVL